MSLVRTLSVLAFTAALAGATGAFAQPPAPAPSAEALKAQLLQSMQAMTAPAAGDEDSCKASAVASWRPADQPVIDWNAPATRIDAALIHPVAVDATGAAARLAATPTAPLTLAEAARLTGVAQAQLKPATPGLAPYLVRAVFPAPNPHLTASWYGDALEVSADSEACAPFANTPVVMFLDRAPSRVFISVASGH